MDLIEDEPDAGGNAPEFSVSELSGAVKRVIEGSFDHVRVRGEVGRVSRPRSGHVYLDLKDDRAVLAAICWKGVAARLEVQPEDGLVVVATGRLTTYPGQSRYQLIVESIAPAGVGALMAMLEKRKATLAAEGLFAAERKREIPFLPKAVGVVTSPSGAVIRDILHRLAERFPLPVLVWPVAVQGKACAPEVANAIRGFNAMPANGRSPRPDVLIVARGGGSVEDLWGFNEEIVSRAAAESEIPLISAVGHETDTTLIDYVADRRAPTPTAAAEMAAPVRGELLAAIAGLEERRARALARGLEERRRRLRDLARALPRPEEITGERRQRLDAAAERLPLALARAADRKRLALASGPAGRFGPDLLRRRITERTRDVAERTRRLAAALSAAAG
ncbi:MAG: exodeoxyribonuclease VII large subunit, partial [Pseudomonadota bacterium]